MTDDNIETCDPYANPKGWREVDGVQLPSVASWAALGDVDVALANAYLDGWPPVARSEPPSTSPWSLIEDKTLDRVFLIWSKGST